MSRVWSRGDQALKHPFKFRNLAIYHAKKNVQKCTFSDVFTNFKKVDCFRNNGKNTPLEVTINRTSYKN